MNIETNVTLEAISRVFVEVQKYLFNVEVQIERICVNIIASTVKALNDETVRYTNSVRARGSGFSDEDKEVVVMHANRICQSRISVLDEFVSHVSASHIQISNAIHFGWPLSELRAVDMPTDGPGLRVRNFMFYVVSAIQRLDHIDAEQSLGLTALPSNLCVITDDIQSKAEREIYRFAQESRKYISRRGYMTKRLCDRTALSGDDELHVEMRLERFRQELGRLKELVSFVWHTRVNTPK